MAAALKNVGVDLMREVLPLPTYVYTYSFSGGGPTAVTVTVPSKVTFALIQPENGNCFLNATGATASDPATGGAVATVDGTGMVILTPYNRNLFNIRGIGSFSLIAGGSDAVSISWFRDPTDNVL